MIFHSDVVFYDMVGRLRKNNTLYNAAHALIKNADKIAAGMRVGKGNPFTPENYGKLAFLASRACGSNFGGLLSGFLPDFRDDKPFSIIERPFMAAMTTLSPGIVVLKAGRQVGKCTTGDTTVATDKLGVVQLRDLFDMGLSI